MGFNRNSVQEITCVISHWDNKTEILTLVDSIKTIHPLIPASKSTSIDEMNSITPREIKSP